MWVSTVNKENAIQIHKRILSLHKFYFFFFVLFPFQSKAWGFFGHRHINYHAVFLLPPEMVSFYKLNIEYIRDHSVDPDKRRYAIPEEGARHYIDMDRYGTYPYHGLPQKWPHAVEKFSEDSLQAHGIGPWWIMVMQNRLKRAFVERDGQAILKLSAEIGHYIADIHVPLHASSNHNGQKTDQIGIHGFWESRLPELYAEQEFDLFIGKASYIDRQLDFIWERVYESARAADSVLLIEKKLSLRLAPHKRIAYEERNGLVVKQFASSYAKLYHQQLNGMVERRMRGSIYAIASFWYSAWLEAGQPTLTGLGKVDLGQDELRRLDSLQSAWIGDRIIGRSCTN